MSIQMNKNCPPLLKTVKGQPHARPEDHQDDITCDPVSSSDNEGSSADIPTTRFYGPGEKEVKPQVQQRRSLGRASKNGSIERANVGRTRSIDNSSGNGKSPVGMGGGIFGDQPKQTKQARIKYGVKSAKERQPGNIHVPGQGSPSKKRKVDHKSGGRGGFRLPTQISAVKPKEKKNDFKMPGSWQNTSSSQPSSSSQGDGQDMVDYISDYDKSSNSSVSTSSNSRSRNGFKAPPKPKFTRHPVANFKQQNSDRDDESGSISDYSAKARPQFITYTQIASRASKDDSALDDRTPSPIPQTIEELEEPRCPMCGADVDRFTLEYLGPRANIRQQQAFCLGHKKKEAEASWNEKGYPAINWGHLSSRLVKYRSSIKSLIDHPEKSHFRREMDKRVRKGKDRTMLQHMKNEGFEGISLGYYGTRGLKIFMDYIILNFSDDIRDLAGSDKLIAARSPSGYIQMVLAPELATLVIMDDMDVEQHQARKIMQESIELGDLLHGNEDDERRPKKAAARYEVEEADDWD